VSLYQNPPPNTRVLCVDEMGPISAKSYFAPRWSVVGQRPRVAPDYGLRGKVWTFGALEPLTGEALTHASAHRDTASFLVFLDQVVTHWSSGDLVVILDNLSVHRALDVRLWALAHERVRFLFQPTYAPWLNLIEPWWKTLRSLALKGRRFDHVDDLAPAIQAATAYWNQHRFPYQWRKSA
jgi:hypothetical protein